VKPHAPCIVWLSLNVLVSKWGHCQNEIFFGLLTTNRNLEFSILFMLLAVAAYFLALAECSK